MWANFQSRLFPWWKACLWWTLRIAWQPGMPFPTPTLMACAMPKKSKCVSNSGNASKPSGGKRVPAIQASVCISRSLLDREAGYEQTHSQLRQVIWMCNSKSNRRNSLSRVVRQLIRPMIRSRNPRAGSLSKRISSAKIRISWRISVIPPYQTVRSSRMLASPQGKIWNPHFMVAVTKTVRVIKAQVPCLNLKGWVNPHRLIILPWIALCRATLLPPCITRFLKEIEAPNTAMTLIWLL